MYGHFWLCIDVVASSMSELLDSALVLHVAVKELLWRNAMSAQERQSERKERNLGKDNHHAPAQ
jgi:hypothetical protein